MHGWVNLWDECFLLWQWCFTSHTFQYCILLVKSSEAPLFFGKPAIVLLVNSWRLLWWLMFTHSAVEISTINPGYCSYKPAENQQTSKINPHYIGGSPFTPFNFMNIRITNIMGINIWYICIYIYIWVPSLRLYDKSPEYLIPLHVHWSLCWRHVQQVEATDCAFAAVANHGVVAWGLPHSGGDRMSCSPEP